MRPLAATVAAGTLAVALAAPVHAAPAPTSYLIKPTGPAADDVFPEGVAADGRTFYVGSTTDGTIYRGNLSKPAAKPFLPGGEDGRTSAIGLKVDAGRLFVAGGATGRFFIYDIDARERLGKFRVSPAPSAGAPTFLNDVAVAPDGSAYVTDSMRPVLYRVGPRAYETDGVRKLKVFRDFTGTALEYTPGFNVNGIVASQDGRFLVLAKSNSGELFRVRVADGQVRKIGLGGEEVSGDGLVLRGRTLYAVERVGDVGRIVKIRMSDGLRSGEVVRRVTRDRFDDPTTAAIADGRMLVVNSQFGERAAGEAPDPFTVSSIRIP
jgi:Cu-Zn family superoxide dismutase